MFDCNAFLRRMDWGQKELAERLAISTSTVGMWCIGKSTPTYPVIVKLLQLGMTPRELFGEEIDEVIRPNYSDTQKAPLPSEFDTPEFRAVIEKAILDMKAKGFIK